MDNIKFLDTCKLVYSLLTLFIYLFIYLALPLGQGHHNSVSQLLWARSTYPTLSTFPVGGNRSTWRKPTTFGRALTLLFSHEDWVRVHHAGIELGTLEVKGKWSDHYTTEALTVHCFHSENCGMSNYSTGG